MNSLPWPGPSLRASTVPPCISTSRRTSVRPIPSPPCARSMFRSTCENISKMRGRASAGMPSPVSRTRTTTSCPATSAVSQMRPPGSVYLALLLSRFENTCASRIRSASR